MSRRNKTLKTLITLLFLQLGFAAEAFVLVGTAVNNGDPAVGNLENTFDSNGSGGVVAGANMIDDLGTPKRIGEFYRWNTPYLSYGFDDSFVQFFGIAGMNAVDDAMRVLNDFFDPEDDAYSGVSDLNLGRHGFGLNYNTMWLNESAAQERLLDIKSVALGSMVNYLGLGNPYRYAFTATNAYATTPGGSGIIFEATLKNFDPITRMTSDEINGVQFSYRLVHDQAPGVLPDAATLINMTVDMEEFTSDTSGNAYSAVSAIVDAFYGNTEMIWTDIPSLFHFGVYYDGANAMGGMYKPRHALTFDDAGGLKYLYSTNTIAMEFSPYVLVAAADFTYPYSVSRYNLPPSSSPLANRTAGIFPTRNAGGLPTVFPSIHPLNRFGNPYGRPNAVGSMGTFSRDGTGFYGITTGMMDWAWRGGIDKIRFVPLGYDSLLNMASYSTNFMWIDTFMTNALIERQVISPGGTIGLVPEGAQYFQQMVGRDVVAPDFLFRAELLGNTPDGVSVAFERTGSEIGTLTSMATTISERNGTTPDTNSTFGAPGGPTGANRYNAWQYNIANGVTFGNPGPGTIVSNPQAGAASFELIFNKEYSIGGFEVMWNGESSVVGNQLVPVVQQQWAYIWGPGSSDYQIFPDGSFTRIIENTVLPVLGVPEITLVSDDGGRSAIEPDSLTRTSEILTILGRNFRSATALEILNSQSAVVQLIYLDTSFIKGDDRIEIPAGIIDYESEGAARQIRVWNTLGSSGLSQEIFSIVTGIPIVFATTYDEVAFDRGEVLTISGVGFKSMQVRPQDGNATLTHIQILNLAGQVIFPDTNSTGFGKDVDVTSQLEVISDTKAILSADTLTSVTDGVNRSMRVSRGSASTLSATRTSFFTIISAKPEISRFSWVNLVTGVKTDINSSNPLRRDESIFIEGVGLNTVTSVELVRENGASYTTPVIARADGISSDVNGTELRLSKFSFNSADADGNGTVKSRLRVENAFGSVIWSDSFNVNIQPNDGSQDSGLQVFINGLPTGEAQGVSALLWDRSQATGEDITFLGSGLKAITKILIIENNGSPMSPEPTLIISSSGGPGVTISDTIIQIDTSLVQFSDISSADATSMTRYVRFKLESDRQPVLTTPEIGQRVLVGIPPTFASYELNSTETELKTHFRRDQGDVMTVHGTALQLLQYIDIIDSEGLAIIPNSSVLVPNPGIVLNETGKNFTLAGTTLSANGGSLDSSEPYSRRLIIKTPWGIVYSDADESGSFSLTADPILSGSAASTFAGGGFTGSSTYDINSTVGTWPNNLLPLIINGQNLLSVSNIVFENDQETAYFSIDINASTPPSGITLSGDGRQIAIAGILILEKSNGWYNSGKLVNRRLKLATVTNREVYTPYIETDPFANDIGLLSTQITSVGGSGWSSGNFERNGTMIINGISFGTPSSVTLVEADGSAISGLSPITGASIIGSTTTAITIAAGVWDGNATVADTPIALGRRVQVTFDDAPTSMSSGFTVSDQPDLNSTDTAAWVQTFAGIGDGNAQSGTYTNSSGTGDISITVAIGAAGDMYGVSEIQFRDFGGNDQKGSSLLTAGTDWTVSNFGKTITIPKAKVPAEVYTLDNPPPHNDRFIRLITPAGRAVDTIQIRFIP